MTIKDITEDFNYDLSIPSNVSLSYENSGTSYDIAINSQPFFVAATEQNPYRRETAPYRREQIDQSTEPGEQSFTGWWFRSQLSFHFGSGIKFFEPSQDETLRYRFTDSEGVNVWEQGELSLLKNVVEGHEIVTNHNHLRSITYSGIDAVLSLDGHDVDKILGDGSVVHFIDYNSGTQDPVESICDDGTTAYWMANFLDGTNKIHFFKKALTADDSVANTLMFNANGVVVGSGRGVMEWVKSRIIACVNNSIYELTPSTSSLPSSLFNHPTDSYTFTSITESGPAIYISGYSGNQSSIYKIVVADDGTTTSLTAPAVAAEMPRGEIVYSLKSYLGYLMIGTNKGVRAAVVNDQDGSISYGPLILETTQPVYELAFNDRFCWATTGVNGTGGLTRIDLSQQISTLRFAYANDLQIKTDNNETTGVAFLGKTNRLVFTTANGYHYIESATDYVSSGYLKSGFIRYSTLENKYYKFIKLRGLLQGGTISVSTITSNNIEEVVVNVTDTLVNRDLGISKPDGGQEYLGFKFNLIRSNDSTTTPIMTGYQIKALPGVEKQRLIQYPLYCFDVEMDKFNNMTGFDGRALIRIQDLEEIEKSGNIVSTKDFRTGEAFQALIEDVRFSSATPPDARFSGFGGILLVTLRKL